MAWTVLGVLALLVTQGISDPVEYNATPSKIADQTFLQRQLEVSTLFYHITEPIQDPELKTIVESWDLEKNIENYKNVTALKVYVELRDYKILLPRSVPFNILEPAQQFEAVTLFNLLFSARDYTTFYKTAVYLRDQINEGLFVYVLSTVIIHHPETQDIIIPPIYEVFPNYFHNAEIMNIAHRINTHGKRFMKYYPQTFLWNDNVVIRWNTTVSSYAYGADFSVSYYLNDYFLNTLYYNNHITYPFWMNGSAAPLSKFKRGEFNWFVNKQYLTRYYLERLSNGLGEIPELGLDVIQEGYSSGLVHINGVPLPMRPNHFRLDQPELLNCVEKIKDIEFRLRDAIERGYVVSVTGEKISLRTPESIDVLFKMLEGTVDSPNLDYYGSLFNSWRVLLGNSLLPGYTYKNGHVPLVVPSALELYQTTARDPAFYMIWKRILSFVNLWQTYLPVYKPEELAFPAVKIQKVEVDKLVTYFENTYMNVTNALPMNEFESKVIYDEVSVLVQRPQLNHKVFKVRINVKAEAAKTVVVRFFLAPKYDSKGFEIPLHLNYKNFFQTDQFTYELPEGESVIKRESTGNMYMIDKWYSGYEVYQKAYDALHGNGQFVINTNNFFDGFPRRLMLPKGRVGGMPFLFFVYISEYRAPKAPYGTGVNPADTLGIGTGSRRMTSYPISFPLDRPLHQWQIQKLTNVHIEEVKIYHKPTPEVTVPNVTL